MMRVAGSTALVAAIALCAVTVLTTATGASAQAVPTPAPSPNRTAPAAAPTVQPKAAPAGAALPVIPRAARFGEPLNFDNTQRGISDRVSQYLSGVSVLSGNFVQVGPDGRRTEGMLYIQKPGKVRFEYNAPSTIDVVADGSSVVVRDRNLATQDLYPLSQTPLRYLVADKIDLLRDTNVISISSDDVFATIVIEERSIVVGTHRLMLMFGAKDFKLRQWTITDPQGYDTTVAVYNLDQASKLDPALFRINYERVLQ